MKTFFITGAAQSDRDQVGRMYLVSVAGIPSMIVAL
jgi:hypothetical protein